MFAMKMMSVGALALLLAGACAPVDDKRDLLNERRDHFVAAWVGEDVDMMMSLMLPSLFEFLAARSDATPEDFIAFFAEQIRAGQARMDVVRVTMDTENAVIRRGENPDGSENLWTLVDANATYAVGGRQVTRTLPTLARFENGNWYFARMINAEEAETMKAAYPFLSEAEIFE